MARESALERARRNITAFDRQMRACTARLWRIEDNRPRADRSGLLYTLNGRLSVLSVLHKFTETGWVLETDCEVDGRALCINLPPINWLAQVRLNGAGKLEQGDDGLAWVELDLKTLREKLAGEDRLRGQAPSLGAYQGPLDAVPVKDELYGFVASPGRYFHAMANFQEREAIFELGMEYDGTDHRGFYRFKLDGEHRGHDHYYGSSGAPIASRDGTVVALVQGGDVRERVIFGFPLAPFARVLALQFDHTYVVMDSARDQGHVRCLS